MNFHSFLIIAFKELTRHLLNNMMGYISLPAILQRVVQVKYVFLKQITVQLQKSIGNAFSTWLHV